jgi:[glutamine synthetase] adenylyltransferase / [glutamine synthetase]-adenylyl-L-tyrosine phosphorylase
MMTPRVEPADARAIRAQLGDGYDHFTSAESSRHVQMLQSIQTAGDLALHTEARGDNRWVVTICTSDSVGTLSIISGLLAAYQMDILDAHIYTLDFYRPQELRHPHRRTRGLHRKKASSQLPPRRKTLDVLEVRHMGPGQPQPWEQFQMELSRLMGMLAEEEQQRALDQVIERFASAIGSSGPDGSQLLPITIDLVDEPSSRFTLLKLRSADTPGFLFAFTHALAIIGINIEHAEVKTINGEVQDTFWLTDRGGRRIESPERRQELRLATALIKEFTYLLPRSPNPGQAMRQFNALIHQLISRPDWNNALRDIGSPSVMETLADLMGVSQFLWEDFLRMQYENLFPVLVDMPALDEGRSLEQLRASLAEDLAGLEEAPDLVRALNRFKDREMFRIDLRHITRRVDFRTFSEELSDLAQTIIAATADLAHQELRARFGTPTLADGAPCPWSICALGKFGGRELGYGSDIEIVAAYQEEGATTGPEAVENSRYFGDFVRGCLAILTTRREGIFDIDLRLRPYGNAGPLASTLGGFQEYYSAQGGARQFERLALVKLRPVAGDPELGRRIVEARDSYVYSGEPLDLENIRHLRHRQATELVASGETSAKHSPGGLVDVEYYVQACQVVAGRRDTGVRVSNTLDAVDRLARGGHLPAALSAELRDTYGFLRRLIDALRVVRGHAKDLTIPPQESREFQYLARRLQYDAPQELAAAISGHMDFARRLWDRGILPS